MTAQARSGSRRLPVGVILMLRRLRADAPLAVLYALVVMVTVVLAVVAPRLADRVGEQGLTELLTSNPDRARVVADIELDDALYNFGRVDRSLASNVQDTAAKLHERLGPALEGVLTEPVANVTTRGMSMPLGDGPDAALRLHYVWSADASGVTWVSGRAPGKEVPDSGTAQTAPIEVAFSEEVAQALAVHSGDQLTLKQPDNSEYTLDVTGLFRPDNPKDPVWAGAPGLVEPIQTPDNGYMRLTVGALLGDDSLPVARLQLPVHATVATYTFSVQPDRLGLDDVAAVSAAIGELRSRPTDLTVPNGPVLAASPTVAVTSDLDTMFDDYSVSLRSAKSQAAVIGIALAVTSALALIVCGGLLAARRRAVLDLEIQRGSTRTMVLTRIAVESLVITAVGTTAGVVIATALVPAPGGVPLLVGLEAIVAISASPLAAAASLGMGAAPPRAAANRADRKRARATSRARRAVAEGGMVALGIVALVAARARGVSQTTTDSIDPLLVAAPVLLALAATTLVVRIMPLALIALRRGAAHCRGVIGVVATARAQSARFGGPAITALTVSLSMIIVCGVLSTSVARGQEGAAQAHVGADVLVHSDSASLSTAAVGLAGSPGVDAVALGRVDGLTQLRVDGTVTSATIVAVDMDDYQAMRTAQGLTALAPTPQSVANPGRPQALVTTGLVDPAATSIEVYWGNEYLSVDVAGKTGPLASVDTPTIVMDAQQLAQAAGSPVLWDTMWVMGQEADAAVAATTSLTGAEVTSRQAEIAQVRATPLFRALGSLLDGGVWLFALFGALVLVLWVISSSPERGRTLSALRTLGLSRRAATVISLAELVPTVVASLCAAAVIGISVPLVLGPALGLSSLSGGVAPPMSLASPAWVVVVGVAVVALVLTVTVESRLRMRTRLGEVLRVGET